LRIEFWGTRGSIARPGPTTVRYGGNTSCVAIQAKDGTRLVFDCGTGAFALGQAWMALKQPVRAHIFIGHTHWDHIQGIPFFAPLFAPGNEFDIYAPCGFGPQLRETLAGQMQHKYFPVALAQLGATIRYHDLGEQVIQVGSVTVRTRYLNHTAVTLGYRIEADGAAVVYATDHEPHERPIGPDGEAVHRPLRHHEDRRHAGFLANADLVIHDTQYTLAEYPAKVGWGHSTLEYALDVAEAAHAKRLALFHHDPLRTDDALDRLVETARTEAALRGSTLEIFAAAEGQTIELACPGSHVPPPSVLETIEVGPRRVSQKRIVVGLRDAPLISAISSALVPEGFTIDVVDDDEQAVALAEREAPALLILSRRSPGYDGLAATARIRQHVDEQVSAIPIVLVAGAEDHAESEAAFAAGVTDWLTRPCSPAFIQSRLRSWLRRMRVGWLKPPLPPNEEERLAAVRATGLLNTPHEERFDRLARLTARALGTSLCYISLMEADHQWFKSCVGKQLEVYPRDLSMCAYTILGDDVLVVPDAAEDSRFGDNPSFHNSMHLRFHAGVPLRGPRGHNIGALCVYDPRPRSLLPEEETVLRDLAMLVEREIEAKPPED